MLPSAAATPRPIRCAANARALVALRGAQIICKPMEHVRAQPADAAAAKATFAGESAEQGETQYHPARPACQACHIVRGKHLFPIRELLVDLRRETNAMRRGRRRRRHRRRLVGIHKRPSCVVPVVQGQIVTCDLSSIVSGAKWCADSRRMQRNSDLRILSEHRYQTRRRVRRQYVIGAWPPPQKAHAASNPNSRR
jgi:hypothetical protein